jgi:hypothetical protein
MDVNEVERDYEVYKQLLDLWAKENPIKTNKLQVLLVVNGLLLTAVNMGGGFKATSWPIYLGGAVLCLVWVLSIGRTSLFQAAWQRKISELSQKYPSDHRFQILGTKDAIKKLPKFLRFVGGVSSKYYLIGAPILFGICWLCVFLYFLLTGL